VSAPRRLAWLVFSTAGLVLLLDQLSKALVRSHLEGRPPIELIPGVLRFSHVTNTGGAFGLSQTTPWFFAAVSFAVVVWIIVRALRGLDSGWIAVGMGLVLGGALGNLVDRASGGVGMTGEVTDFIDFHVWPVFNLADSAIFVGAILLAITLSRRPSDERTA
jgi:signal peptidase II